MNPASSPGPLLFLGCKTRTTLHSFSQATFLDQKKLCSSSKSRKGIHLPLFSSSKYFLNQEHYRALLKDSTTNILRPPSLKSFIITFRFILLPCHPTENHGKTWIMLQALFRTGFFAPLGVGGGGGFHPTP